MGVCTDNDTSPGDIRPRAFTLELTKGCNLRCGYCYYAAREDAYDPSNAMSHEVAMDLSKIEGLISEGLVTWSDQLIQVLGTVEGDVLTVVPNVQS